MIAAVYSAERIKWLEEANFNGAIFNQATLWPKNFDPRAAGAILPKCKDDNC